MGMTPMSNFGNCVRWVLQLEDRGLRGVIRNLGDGAGLTRFGITQKNNASRVPADFFTTATAEVALQDAMNAYYEYYWLPSHSGVFQTDELAATYFAFYINTERQTAIRCLQTVVGVKPDGVYGPATLVACQAISNEADAADRLRAQIEAFYMSLGGPNLRGWLARAGAVYPALP